MMSESMICPKFFTDELVDRGVNFFTGVPCSYLTTLINETIARKDTQYTIASSEGEAVSLASGAWLAGKMGVVMCQNSGFGNMINPLTSLNAPFGIPILLLITWRGKPGEIDEPQHEIMGRITPDLLTLLGIPWLILPKEQAKIPQILDTALAECQQTHKPFALIIEKDSFVCEEKNQNVLEKDFLSSRAEVLKAIVQSIPPDCPVIATTGKTGRELYTVQDNERHLYCVGSMGYANALAHGVALNTVKKVYVIDGDGAAIMHLGNLTSIGLSGVKNLIHILLDNGTYDSTGGQQTASVTVNFAGIAKSCGYKQAVNCSSIGELEQAIKAEAMDGPKLIYMRISKGSMAKLGRPTITPHEVARRLHNFIQKSVT